MSLAGELQGLVVPRQRNLKLTPYVLGESVRRTAERTTTGTGDFGADLKYSVTPSLTLDAIYNTDFAQVEVDDQQINLDRFNLFFPEKRPFFLENAGLFSVGQPGSVDIFFSRRIGIGDNGEQIPILGGGRLSLSGKIGTATNIGFLNMQTGSMSATGAPSQNFTVARIRQDLPNRSNIGTIVVNRQAGSRVRSISSSAAGSGSGTTASRSRFSGSGSGRLSLSGKIGTATNIGFLNMQTGSMSATGAPSQNFTVARIRQDLPNRSNIGTIVVNRQATGSLAGDRDYNRTYAVDGRLGIGQGGTISGFAAETETSGGAGTDTHAYGLSARHESERARLSLGYSEVGPSFNPEVGFYQRRGYRSHVRSGAGAVQRPRRPLVLERPIRLALRRQHRALRRLQ